jgi:ribosome-associated protein
MENKKSFDITVLDLRESSAFTDFFVIGSGQTSRQVKAITESIEARLKSGGVRPSHIEGAGHLDWVLMDYFDIIVHVFKSDVRQQYELERLWGTATRIPIPSSSSTGETS